MTLSECRSKSQFNVFEKWDRKNLDDQLMRIFTETVSTILNFLSKKVSQASSDATLCAVASLDNAYFYFKDGNISLSEREDIRTERTQMDTGCARTTHAWNSAKGKAVRKMPSLVVHSGLLRTNAALVMRLHHGLTISVILYLSFCIGSASDYSSVGRAGDCRG